MASRGHLHASPDHVHSPPRLVGGSDSDAGDRDAAQPGSAGRDIPAIEPPSGDGPGIRIVPTVGPELHARAHEAAERQGISVSGYLASLIDRADVDDERRTISLRPATPSIARPPQADTG